MKEPLQHYRDVNLARRAIETDTTARSQSDLEIVEHLKAVEVLLIQQHMDATKRKGEGA
jgi:hypothetical protein